MADGIPADFHSQMLCGFLFLGAHEWGWERNEGKKMKMMIKGGRKGRWRRRWLMEPWWIRTFFVYFLQSLGANSGIFFSSCAQLPCCWSFFLLYTVGLTLFGGKFIEQNTVAKEFLPLSVPNSIVPLPVSIKPLWNQYHHALWERKASCFLISAGSFFFLSLYIGLRNYTVSLYEYGQLAFTNM